MTGLAAPDTPLCWDATFPSLRLEGPGARDFLQGQTSADFQTSQTELISSCWLTATGRLRALLEIRLDPLGADVLILAGDADQVSAGFDQVIFPADRVRLQPAGRQRRLQALFGDTRVQWLAADAALPGDWGSWPAADAESLERWRIMHGMPTGRGEMSGDTNPYELGLAHWVSLSKGCYLGQETMAKLASKGGVKQQLRRWQGREEIQAGTTLQQGAERAGLVTSSLRIAADDCWIGLALIRRQHLDRPNLEGPQGQQLTLSYPDGFTSPPAPSGS